MPPPKRRGWALVSGITHVCARPGRAAGAPLGRRRAPAGGKRSPRVELPRASIALVLDTEESEDGAWLLIGAQKVRVRTGGAYFVRYGVELGFAEGVRHAFVATWGHT